MPIKAIIFDLDDTLLVEEASAEVAFVAACKLVNEKYGINPQEFNSAVRKKARDLWYSSPARQYCVDIAISSWEGLWARFEGDDPNLEILRKWAPTYQLQPWINALAQFDIKDDSFAEQLSKTYQSTRRGLHTVYPDVEPALKELRRKYNLALVTNGASSLQREKIAGSKLEPYFVCVVISGDIGIRKPEPGIFLTVLEKLGVGAEASVMVGNNLESDITGAKEARIRAIWLNRDNEENQSDIKPDYEINNMNELKPILDGLE